MRRFIGARIYARDMWNNMKDPEGEGDGEEERESGSGGYEGEASWRRIRALALSARE